jgi:4-amino-4-deoxy-L-arabinose transferase-like glycosyltransferase
MNYLFHYPDFFSAGSLWLLVSSVLLSISTIFFFKKNEPLLRLVLFAMGALVAGFACSLDMFIHDWDEQFHALVAKNMMSNPFDPVLFKNVLLTDNNAWYVSHVWLHKQPLFLWQIALSFKAFGVNEWSLRLPNIIAHGFMTIAIYDIGKLARNELVGSLSAITFCFLKFPLCFASGMLATDHNDYMFLFYITVSFWALLKFKATNSTTFLFLTGLFCGCAVLVKWLPGFLPIGVWCFYNLLFERKQLSRSLLALGVALLISIPWQVYCYLKYKSIFLAELNFNMRHFSEALENHVEPWYFHFSAIRELYANNDLIFFAIGLSLLYLAFSRKIDKFIKFSFLVSIFLVYTFFTLAKTRMPAFCMIVSPLIIVSIVLFICELMDKIRNEKIKNLAYFILIPQMIIFFFGPDFFLEKHTLGYKITEEKISRGLKEKEFILDLNKNADEKTIFLNTYPLAVKIMFYTNHEACNWPVSKETIAILRSQNYKLIAIDSNLPEYMLNDTAMVKIPSYEQKSKLSFK